MSRSIKLVVCVAWEFSLVITSDEPSCF